MINDENQIRVLKPWGRSAERTGWVGERVDRLCTERHPGVWHNEWSPRHVDASRDFFFLYFLRMSSGRGEGGGRCQTFEHRPPPTFRYCLWIARGFYPNDTRPSLPEQTFIARTNPKTLRGLARALSESVFQFSRGFTAPKRKSECPVVRLSVRFWHNEGSNYAFF